MTHKGFFTQCLVILLRTPVSLSDILDRLSAFQAEVYEARVAEWFEDDHSVVLPFRAEVNGGVVVDLVDRPWPDHLGDIEREIELFAASHMGHFGVTWPFSLKRACIQSWGWAEGNTVPLSNKAFLRVRSTYLVNASDDTLTMPPDYEPLSELKFVTRVAAALAGLPQAISYFDPAGERVWAPKAFTAYFAQAEAQDSLPISIWCNLRHVDLKDRAEGWCLVDTMGMVQFDAADHEAIFPSTRYKSAEVGELLLNIATYIAQNGPVIANGDPVDGPGDLHWQATHVEESQALPQRAVIRWLPMDGRPVPPAVITAPKPRTGA